MHRHSWNETSQRWWMCFYYEPEWDIFYGIYFMSALPLVRDLVFSSEVSVECYLEAQAVLWILLLELWHRGPNSVEPALTGGFCISRCTHCQGPLRNGHANHFAMSPEYCNSCAFHSERLIRDHNSFASLLFRTAVQAMKNGNTLKLSIGSWHRQALVWGKFRTPRWQVYPPHWSPSDDRKILVSRHPSTYWS